MKLRGLAPICLAVAGFFFGVLPGPIAAAPLGSAFSYQGRLLDNGSPANGRFDLRFGLFTSDTGGLPQATQLTNANVAVSNGLFTTTLDFGADVFAGASFWLEIGVRKAGASTDFVTLQPRQPLTPAPYAIYTLKAESLTGPLPASQLPANVARLDANQNFTGIVSFSGAVGIGTTNPASALDVRGGVTAGTFSGDGAGLSNVTAVAFSARQMQRLWRVGGGRSASARLHLQRPNADPQGSQGGG